jgi:hypothetical protein
MRGNLGTIPFRARRTAIGLAGLAIALGGLSATAGPAAAAPGIDIQNPDGIPFADRLVMNRTQGGADNVTVKDVATARIVNSGDQPLNVTGLALTGPFQFVAPAALPAAVPAGGALELPVRFVAQEEGPAGGRHDGTLTISSDAANAPSRVVELSGFWQTAIGGNNEGTLTEILSTFGYATTIVGPGQKLQNKSKVEAVGDEVLSPLWRRADLSKPVSVRQIGAFHGKTEGIDTFAWYPKDGPASAVVVLEQAESDYQTLLPRRLDLGPGEAGFTPPPESPVFGFRLAGQWSDPALNPRPGSCVGECGHMVRFWPLEDRAGIPMAGQYLATMDFANATSGNYDYQDNFYIVGNVVPADAMTDTTAPTVTSRQPAPGAAGVPVGADVVAGFSEPMHPGSLTPANVALAAGGVPVAATITLSEDGTVLTIDPLADLAPAIAYTVTIATAAVDTAGNPLAAAESWSFTTAGPTDPGPTGPGPGPTGTDTTPQPGVKDPSSVPAPAAVCTRYPQLRVTLARQLAAAKKLRAKALTPKARAAAAKRIVQITRKQRQASARLTAACGAKAAYCLRFPDLKGAIARDLAAARKARAAATTRAARAAAAKRIAQVTKRQKQAAARFTATCRTGSTAAGGTRA